MSDASKIPLFAKKKATDLLNMEAGGDVWTFEKVANYPAVIAFARYIAEHEEGPVDQDVLDVREILAGACDGDDFIFSAKSCRAGNYDNEPYFQEALAAFRKIMERRNG